VNWQLLVTVAGWSGAVGLLIGYALVSSGRMAGDGLGYQLVNVLGSIGLGAAAFVGRVWSSVALNGVWVLIGLAALSRLRATRRRGQLLECSDHCTPSGVSRTSTPAAVSRSRTRSDAA
jgi:hypothetical protein